MSIPSNSSQCRRSSEGNKTCTRTLRFQYAASEAAFLASRRVRLERGTRCVGLIAFVVVGSGMMYLFGTLGNVPNIHATRMVMFGSLCLVLLVWFCAVLLASIPKLKSAVSDQHLEIFTVFTFFCSVFATFGSSIWYASIFSGQGPEVLLKNMEISNGFSDTEVLLTGALVQVSSHMVMPIRSFALWPLEFFGIAFYGGMAVFGMAPEGLYTGLYNFLLYSALVCGMSIGRRSSEKYEREAMESLISERVKRVRAEFEREKLPDPRPSQGDAGARSIVESCPSTTATGFVFNQEGASLDAVADLGVAERWLLHPSEIHLKGCRRLGEGSFGLVVSASYHGAEVAIKLAKNSSDKLDTQGRVSFLNELRILRHLHHPNIVGFIGACLDIENGDIAIVLEMVRGVCLRKFLCSSSMPDPTDRERIELISDVGAGLTYLHSRLPIIVHGDMKDSNIFVTRIVAANEETSINAKLLDFGLSRVITRKARPLGGSLRWIAPEVFLGGCKPGVAADVFSFGKLIFFVATNLLPSANQTKSELIRTLKVGDLSDLPWPADGPLVKRYKNVSISCLHRSPDKRPTILDATQTLQGGNSSCMDSFHIENPSGKSHALYWQPVLRHLRNLPLEHTVEAGEDILPRVGEGAVRMPPGTISRPPPVAL